MVTIRYFGKLQDNFPRACEEIALPRAVKTASDLRHFIATRTQGGDCVLASSVRIVINQRLQSWLSPVQDGDEVAFIPPVSGG